MNARGTETTTNILRRRFFGNSVLVVTAALWPIASAECAEKSEKCGEIMQESPWTCALELRSDCSVLSGSTDALCDAIRRGADLRIQTEFIHGEHIAPDSPSREIVREVCDFQITYLLDDRWAAGIIQQRQPISLPGGFGDRPSMSFFLYNQNGEQGIARPYLDGRPATGQLGSTPAPDHSNMPKYHQRDNWDAGTNAPSHNFTYDFEIFRYFVRDDWRQVLEHDAEGNIVSGSVDALGEAFTNGRQVKLAIGNLCSDLAEDTANSLRHEVFMEAGSCYYYTKQKLFIAGVNPLVRVRPAIPLQYGSQNWDVTWLMARTDGVGVLRRADPYTLKFDISDGHYPIRWFVR